MRIAIIAWLALTLAFPPSLHAGPPDPPGHPSGLGMWVWSKSSFATEEARQRLVRFCVKYGISHLDVHIILTKDKGNPRVQDAEAFRNLVLLAGQRNITTAALRGNPRMFSSQNHERSLRELSAIIAFSESLPEKNLFKGIKYDVEPYLTKEWKVKGIPLNTAMHDYLAIPPQGKNGLARKSAPSLACGGYPILVGQR